MRFKCCAAREVLLVVSVIGILSALIVPEVCTKSPGRRSSCSHNLRQLYQVGAAYAASHHGRWPEATGSALWRSFAETKPPLIEPEHLEILACPFRDDWEPGRCDYLGPRKPVSALGPGDALAGDRPGNHGDSGSGNVLFKDGSVREADASDPVWQSLSH